MKETRNRSLNLTTSIPVDLMTRFRNACQNAGITQSQALIASIVFHYVAPAATGDLDAIPEPMKIEGSNRPDSPNLHARIPGILGKWFEEIVDANQDRRDKTGDPLPVTKTEVVAGVIKDFCEMVEGGQWSN